MTETLSPPDVTRSRELLERSDQILVRGCNVHKHSHRMMERGYPVFARSARGCRFTDADGHEYLDYLMGFGPILLGYDDPNVRAAVDSQMRKGTINTLAHEQEIAVAELLLELNPWGERVGFLIGGSACVGSAVRLARAHTGRSVVVRCGYHGWHDWAVPNSAGVPAAVSALTREFPYNDLDALEARLRKGDVACVVVETVQENGPAPGFLSGCVELAHSYGALCVFDETKTGFRVALGGAAEYYEVTPDIATFGKACANGLPGSFLIAAPGIASKGPARDAWLAATFHADLLSLSVIPVVIDQMRGRDGLAHFQRLGRRLIDGVNQACAEGRVPYRLGGLPAMPTPLVNEEDKPRYVPVLLGALKRGVYLHPGHAMFLSLSHTMDDIEFTIDAVRASVAECGGGE